MDIQQGVVLVTGASSGVGRATAVRAAEQGAHVLVNYNGNRDGAEATAAAVRDLGSEALVVQGDVADDGACRAMAQAALDQWGRIDALVNNAGTTTFCDHADLEGLDAGTFQRIYGVNTIGAFQMVRAVAPAMQQAGRGAVVNVASIAAVTGVGSSIAYAASKGALVTMTLSLARALGPAIRVNAVCPGFIQGEWLRDGLGAERYEAVKSAMERTAPLGVTATADTVADAVMGLVSGFDVVTGETLIVDGGAHLATAPLGRR